MPKFSAALALVASLLAGLHPGLNTAAAAERPAYPSRPVRIIVPFPPGGSDVIARMLALKLTERLGQTFIVDNRPGAGGMLGTDIASKAAPDGYTLLFATASFPVTAVYFKKLPYDANKDFTAIGSVGSVPFMLAAHPSLPARSVKEFVSFAKARPGELNYSSPGTGSIGHLATVLFGKQTGIRITHVPYKGTGPAVAALIIGEIHFMLPNLIGALPHVRAGKVRALGVASTQRSPLAPDVPTMTEAGVTGYTGGTHYGVLAPAGTLPDIVRLLNREIVALLHTQDLRDRLATQGVVPDSSTPEEYWKFLQSEMAKWDGVIKDAGISRE